MDGKIMAAAWAVERAEDAFREGRGSRYSVDEADRRLDEAVSRSPDGRAMLRRAQGAIMSAYRRQNRERWHRQRAERLADGLQRCIAMGASDGFVKHQMAYIDAARSGDFDECDALDRKEHAEMLKRLAELAD